MIQAASLFWEALYIISCSQECHIFISQIIILWRTSINLWCFPKRYLRYIKHSTAQIRREGYWFLTYQKKKCPNEIYGGKIDLLCMYIWQKHKELSTFDLAHKHTSVKLIIHAHTLACVYWMLKFWICDSHLLLSSTPNIPLIR